MLEQQTIAMKSPARLKMERLLAEDIRVARDREQQYFERLSGVRHSKIVLFGAGGLGRKCLAGLRHSGVEPVAFADNNENLWGKQIEGVDVLAPRDAANRFGQSAVFVVTIWGAFGKDRMQHHLQSLRGLGCDAVIPFGPLFWRYPERLLPHYAADLPHLVLEQKQNILRCFDLWADEESRNEFAAQLEWRLSFDFGAMGAPARDSVYFPPDIVQLSSTEVFVDCGAYTGDTLSLFVQHAGPSFRRAHCFEPDPANFGKLSKTIASFPDDVRERVNWKCAAVSRENGTVQFSAEGSASSAVGVGDFEVECVSLDRYFDPNSSATDPPTFIKMDIEGAEPDAIRGAASAIRDCSPLLAISCYHRQDHLWSIPLLIHSLNPEYRFYLRPHDLEGWDLVCYAVPPSRLPMEGVR
ncbi:MAG: FkbM family methyltransferase [Bryobacteraceae bacterium]